MRRNHNGLRRNTVLHQASNHPCSIQGCDHAADSINSLCTHLGMHMGSGKKVVCPYEGCSKSFRVRSSFTAHVSRKHRHPSRTQFVGVLSDNVTDEVSRPTTSNDNCINESVGASDFDVDVSTSITDGAPFLKNLALFYLKMQAKFLLPATTMQCIIDEFQEVHNIGMKRAYEKIEEKLTELDIPKDCIHKIIAELEKEDLLTIHNEGVLRSDKTRKTFFKENFNYVPPNQIYLGTDGHNGKERFCQYIPIRDTLSALFRQSTVREQYLKSKERIQGDSMILNDVCDGAACKNNIILQESPSAVSIILFQDAFEVTSPLGSGKKKHKIIAMYMTLVDILPHNRSAVDQTQLVLLCREEDFKAFGQDKVFGRVLEDLQSLEEQGFPLDDGTYVKASLIAICGDNLGSHGLGGFTENFSTSKHFCRYCTINREDFKNAPLKCGTKRTTANYNESIEQLSDEIAVVNGIKFNSIFNSLKSFHVCGGLPPCLGHDLFEGVVADDMALYIKHLVQTEKHFTYDQINRAISQTKHLGSDSNSQPCHIKQNAKKLSGSATQNWCFLRLLPVYVGRWIKHPLDSEVWQLCLKLKEITELICAPKINHNEIAYLKVMLEEYVYLRTTMFPGHNLKPKHHYLLHYPDLILQFGPLIRVWTLRFESKHSYFKECARKLHNFLNLSKTLAERHQLLQSYLSSGQLFPPTIQVAGVASELDIESYNSGIQSALQTSVICKHATSEVSALIYKGSKYTKGLVVVLDHSEEDTLVFGKIALILIDDKQVYFVVLVHHSVFLIDLGVHHLNQSENKYVCVHADSLLDYYPLPVYTTMDIPVISLHHSVCSPF